MERNTGLAIPLEAMLRDVAVAVTESQVRIDRDSAKRQRELDRTAEHGEGDPGIEIPWYALSEVDIDLRLDIDLRGNALRDENGRVRAYDPVLAVSPTDGDHSDTASIKARLVPKPPSTDRQHDR